MTHRLTHDDALVGPILLRLERRLEDAIPVTNVVAVLQHQESTGVVNVHVLKGRAPQLCAGVPRGAVFNFAGALVVNPEDDPMERP